MTNTCEAQSPRCRKTLSTEQAYKFKAEQQRWRLSPTTSGEPPSSASAHQRHIMSGSVWRSAFRRGPFHTFYNSFAQEGVTPEQKHEMSYALLVGGHSDYDCRCGFDERWKASSPAATAEERSTYVRAGHGMATNTDAPRAPHRAHPATCQVSLPGSASNKGCEEWVPKPCSPTCMTLPACPRFLGKYIHERPLEKMEEVQRPSLQEFALLCGLLDRAEDDTKGNRAATMCHFIAACRGKSQSDAAGQLDLPPRGVDRILRAS